MSELITNPSVANQPPQMIYEHSYSPDWVHMSATPIGVALSCSEVEEVLAEPMRQHFDGTKPFNEQFYLHRGLSSYTYPNSKIANNAAQMGREIAGSLRSMGPDMRRLVRSLKREAANEETVIPVRATTDQAFEYLHSREQLVTMKPSKLVAFCEQLGVPTNELEIWKLKGGNRKNRDIRLYQLDDLGTDSERLRRELAARLFKRVDILHDAGVEMHLVLRADLPDLPWLERVTFGRKVRALPSMHDEFPRIEVAFRSDAIKKREVVPVISWGAVGEDDGHFSLYGSRRKKFDFHGSRTHFDEESRRLTIFSPIVGNVIFSSEVGLPKDLGRRAYRMFLPHYESKFADKKRKGRPVRLPFEALASVPSVLTDRHYAEWLLKNPAFSSIEQGAVNHVRDQGKEQDDWQFFQLPVDHPHVQFVKYWNQNPEQRFKKSDR